LTSRSKSLWKNEYFQTAVMIGLIVIIVFGFWYGSRAVLNTDYPMLAVASGSMCYVQGASYVHGPVEPCDGWTHPFARTLHTGDLIVVQGINASDIHAGSDPYGDIIVYRRSTNDELIVHRAISKTENTDGTVTLVTKGDANLSNDSPITGDQVIGKVILRIPWIGHLALIMRNSAGLYLIVALIMVLILIELVIPVFRGRKPETAPQLGSQEPQDSTNSSATPSTTSHA
jgi:signal peptidase I